MHALFLAGRSEGSRPDKTSSNKFTYSKSTLKTGRSEKISKLKKAIHMVMLEGL